MDQIYIPGLKCPVTINQDGFGVSHIFAQNELDLFIAQGYITSKDRLVQMELMRRKGHGRLAEILGPKQINSDWFELTLGLSLVARAQLERYQKTNSPMLPIMEAYAQGVNARIDELRSTQSWPSFFKAAKYEPQPWTVLDTLIIQGLITQELAFGLGQLDRRNFETYLGKERTDGILPEWPYKKQSPYDQGPYPAEPRHDKERLLHSLLNLGPGRGVGGWHLEETPDPGGSGTSSIEHVSLTPDQDLPDLSEFGDFSFLGRANYCLGNSNNWVVSGKITDTGKPYLAGDPHLGLTIPSIWYEIHLCCPSLNVYGVNFPGVPCVIIGHNSKVAWSPTNGQNIQTIYYRENTDPSHPGKYYHNNHWVDFSYYEVTIPVRGDTPKKIVIPWTIHGPVINRLLPQFSGIQKDETISMAYTGNLFSDLMKSMYFLNRAKDACDIEEALSFWGSPVQNFAYATSDGDFGIISPGYYPLIKSGQPWVVLPGTGECDWAGLIPYDHVPSTKNPQRQYACSANERQVGKDYPYTLGSSDNCFCGGWRSETINAFLSNPDNYPLTKSSMEKLQACNFDSLAQAIVPVLISTALRIRNILPISLPKEIEDSLNILESWNFEMNQDEKGPLIWDSFITCYFEEVFKPWWRFSGLDQFERYSLKDFYFSSAGWKGAFLQTLEVMTTEPVSSDLYRAAAYPGGESTSWFYNPVYSEDRHREQVLAIAFLKGVNRIKEEFGPDPENWAWGNRHKRRIPSLLEQKQLDRGPYPADGNCRTPNASGGKEPSTHGPSWRMIVSLKDPCESWSIYPGGQSEDPFSPHYDDQFHLWKDYRYKKIVFETTPAYKLSDNIKAVYRLTPPKR
ncbi:MAG TPA: penicillin acylase family protein [Bacillota bacterium]|nr:penicillin acylase family protein [Bacillota bacterium]